MKKGENMRTLGIVLLLIVSVSAAQANNFYQYNNPFPAQTAEPGYNNIYATEPQAEVKEEITKKKMGFWNWKRKDATNIKNETSPVNEGIIKGSQDGSFYVFPAK